jgi:WD40 repeat protein
MDSYKLITKFLIFSFLVGCSPTTVTPSIQASPTDAIVTATLPVPSPTMTQLATLEPEFPEGCISLIETPLNTDVLNGLLVVSDFALLNFNSYFLDPRSNQLLDIETRNQVSWDAPATNVSTTKVSPNKKIIQAYLTGKNYDILRTVDEIIKTYDTQGQEDWNRGRWLDNERMFFQYWAYPNGGTIVIYNPFTGEQKNIQLDLPNPYIVNESLGKVTWVKADIDPTLKRVLYNDKDERLALWDLDTQKEIASLPSPMNVIDASWSPDGKEFVIPSPSTVGAPQEMFIMNMEGVVKKTSLNQKYPFASVSTRPSWSPDGHYIAFWLQVSNFANADFRTLRQWLAIIDTTTLDTQIYCLSPNKPPTGGGGIVWNPDSTQVIVNTDVLSEDIKPD